MTAVPAGRPHVRAVRWTARPDAWCRTVDALGGREVIGLPGDRTFAMGAGCLVLRSPGHGSPVPPDNPVTAIELGAPEYLDEAQLTGPDGMSIARVRVPSPGHRGPRRSDSPTRSASGRYPQSGTVSVCPLLMASDVPVAATALQSAGMTVRLSSKAGQWVDLMAGGGGLIAVHADVLANAARPPHAVLAFEASDIAPLAARFADRGLRADIVDESYGRSLRIDDPDGGIELWVNETMTDLYGYRWGGSA